jgi:hypothetical protein
MSNAVKVIRAYARVLNVPRHYVYNDPLVDGRRSVKVVGWKYADYANARDVLRAAGMSGRIVRNTNIFGNAPYRLWVD